jgi:hypothetical protein
MNNSSASTTTAAAAAPAAPLDMRTAEQRNVDEYNASRKAEGLSTDSLTFNRIVQQTVLVGFFSGMLVNQMQALYAGGAGVATTPAQNRALALTSFSATMVGLAAARFYLDTAGLAAWRTSLRWTRVWMRFLNFFIFTAMLTTTNFVIRVISDGANTNTFVWYETLAFIYLFMLTVFFLFDVLGELT